MANVGTVAGALSTGVLVDGAPVSTQMATLAPSASVVKTFTVSSSEAGEHTVTVEGLSGTFTIPPATFRVVDFGISTKTLGPDDAAEVSGMVTNTGGVAGDFSLVFRVSGSGVEGTASGTLPPGSSAPLLFTTSQGRPGTYTATFDLANGQDASGQFTVLDSVVVQVQNQQVHLPTQTADFGADDPDVGNASFSALAQVTAGEQGKTCDFEPKKDLSPRAMSGFELLALGEENTIADVAYALEVACQEGVKTASAELVMKVADAWVMKVGGVQHVRIGRLASDGTVQFLSTTCTGPDMGLWTCRTASPNGFSTFGLIGVARRSPDLAVSQLIIAPQVVQPNEVAIVSARVTNEGSQTGFFNLLLQVDGVVTKSRRASVNPGQNTLVTFPVKRAEEGTYKIQVRELTGFLEVAEPLAPALASLANLRVKPTEVAPNQTVSVAVTVTNSGDTEGSYTAFLKLNGAVTDAQTVRVPPRSATDVIFTIQRERIGDYVATIGHLMGQFAVTKSLAMPTFRFNLLTITPPVVQVGQSASISVLVENRGERQRDQEAVLMVNGQEVGRQRVTLDAHTGQILTFQFTPEEAGTHLVAIEGLNADLRVVRAPEVLTPIPTLTGAPEPNPTSTSPAPGMNFGLVIGVPVGALTLAALTVAGVVFLVRRR